MGTARRLAVCAALVALHMTAAAATAAMPMPIQQYHCRFSTY